MATILVVDDSPVIRRLISYTLARSGYAVVTANDGYEAVDALAAQSVDLVIADLAMPRMDGMELLRHIRADQRMDSVQIVMLTASGQDHDRVEAQAAGVNGFLTKPASSRDLLDTVGRLLA